MKIICSLTLLLFTTLLLAYEDSDLDGVENTLDRCPNTPFSELVDINGCSVKSLISSHKFDLIVGASYSDSDYQTLNQTDTLSTSLQLDYYYKNFSLQLATSYFSTSGDEYSDSGFNDTFISTFYNFSPQESLLLRVGFGLVLPTYEAAFQNNNLDYSAQLSLSYQLQSVNLFASYLYTLINDDEFSYMDNNNTKSVSYQNTAAASLGLGYYLDDSFYLSTAYNTSNSIYRDIEDIDTLSLYGYYSISKEYFTTLSYAYGLSDSASKHYLSLRLGYLF
jgi:hypothetical protein